MYLWQPVSSPCFFGFLLPVSFRYLVGGADPIIAWEGQSPCIIKPLWLNLQLSSPCLLNTETSSNSLSLPDTSKQCVQIIDETQTQWLQSQLPWEIKEQWILSKSDSILLGQCLWTFNWRNKSDPINFTIMGCNLFIAGQSLPFKSRSLLLLWLNTQILTSIW